jgi:hypothetical protein
MLRFQRLIPLVAASALCAAAVNVAPAAASTTQASIFQDDSQLFANPAGTLQTFRNLGVSRVRVGMDWSHVAPQPTSTVRPNFNAADPAAYPAANWAVYDAIVRDAQADGISVYFILTGPAPLWATGPGAPANVALAFREAWKPSASAFNQFVRAVGTRYSGHYQGLPRVNFWSIWNEPNYGFDLAPQATHHDTVEVGAMQYRGLVDAAWSGLAATGHGRDTILIGETAPRGLDHPIGDFSGVKPLRFLRALYCVGSNYRPLRGAAARERGCPTSAAGSRRFRSQHPGLFNASGYAAHPYPGAIDLPPNETTALASGNHVVRGSDPDFVDFARIGVLEGTLDRLNRAYGSRTRFPIWNTEYGYQTKPPEPNARINAATAAVYVNWGEYLSWRQPRLKSYMQYLLVDPPGHNFASGLLFSNGAPKADYDAYRMPLFMPVTSGRRGRALEVWGGARPARYGGSRSVAIQFQAGSRGAWQTLKIVPLSRGDYFDVRLRFSRSGSVRLVWSGNGQVLHSRSQQVSIR